MEKQMSDYFLSCDWGTSSFRLKLVNLVTKEVLGKVEHAQGIKATFEAWKNAGEKDRFAFYQAILQEAINKLATQTNLNLQNLPLVLSGMASSSIGMKELPYAEIPIDLIVKYLKIERIPSSDSFFHTIFLVSGIQKEGDVMRGEEIQAIGWAQNRNLLKANYTLILPGTHSKHLHLEAGRLVDFKTYMTGELFEIIAHHSILQNSVDRSSKWTNGTKAAFIQGVLDSQQGNLSNLLFSIRAKDLQESWSRGEASFYLSGLLIGNEVTDLSNEKIVLFGDSKFEKLYQTALEALRHQNYEVVPPREVENLVVWGQMAVLTD
ncbi:MAG: 2-dehydro-3-deoxygalactonokinase [Bacteroidota bacterium]